MGFGGEVESPGPGGKGWSIFFPKGLPGVLDWPVIRSRRWFIGPIPPVLNYGPGLVPRWVWSLGRPG